MATSTFDKNIVIDNEAADKLIEVLNMEVPKYSPSKEVENIVKKSEDAADKLIEVLNMEVPGRKSCIDIDEELKKGREIIKRLSSGIIKK